MSKTKIATQEKTKITNKLGLSVGILALIIGLFFTYLNFALSSPNGISIERLIKSEIDQGSYDCRVVEKIVNGKKVKITSFKHASSSGEIIFDYQNHCNGVSPTSSTQLFLIPGAFNNSRDKMVYGCQKYNNKIVLVKKFYQCPKGTVCDRGSCVLKNSFSCVAGQTKGDINNDQIIDRNDTNIILAMSVEIIPKTITNMKCCADLNGDNGIYPDDAVLIQRLFNQPINNLPKCWDK